MNHPLRTALAQGKTKQVIAELLKLTTHDADLHNQVVQLSARFAQYERQQLGNLESSSVLGIELNKINVTVMAIIDELEESNPISVGFSKFSWTKWTGLNDVKSWVALLAGLAGILTFYFKYCGNGASADTFKNVTVIVRGKDEALVDPLHTKAYVIMTTSGGGAPKELIDDKGVASFKNIKVGDKVRLNIDFSEPYRPIQPDSIYTVPEDGRIHLIVALQHLGKVYGRVMYRDKELSGVIVAVGSLRDTTDDLGRYEIQIPANDQRPEQEVFFKKEGFKSITNKDFPQTDQPLNVVMEK
ncbi:hypothetical protein [Runella sp.]|uniref:hypothetical protein n=1 Tax=Runella sp. TaxID=1960881 RepID=UPI00301AA5AC